MVYSAFGVHIVYQIILNQTLIKIHILHTKLKYIHIFKSTQIQVSQILLISNIEYFTDYIL